MTKIYQVGGSVRDQLLGQKPKDLDYAVEAPSFDAMRDEINARGYKIFLETPKYLTIRAHGPNGPADFSLCRKDGLYKDGRHPESVEPASIQDDLARRDFTVNAIAIDLDSSEVLDPFDGKKDLEYGYLRCVGKAEDRFEEDRLRAIRAIRFAITKGFTIETKTLQAIHRLTLAHYKSVSTDRIRDELYKMFAHDSVETMRWLVELDAICEVIRERELWLKPTTEQVK